MPEFVFVGKWVLYAVCRKFIVGHQTKKSSNKSPGKSLGKKFRAVLKVVFCVHKVVPIISVYFGLSWEVVLHKCLIKFWNEIKALKHSSKAHKKLIKTWQYFCEKNFLSIYRNCLCYVAKRNLFKDLERSCYTSLISTHERPPGLLQCYGTEIPLDIDIFKSIGDNISQ